MATKVLQDLLLVLRSDADDVPIRNSLACLFRDEPFIHIAPVCSTKSPLRSLRLRHLISGNVVIVASLRQYPMPVGAGIFLPTMGFLF